MQGKKRKIDEQTSDDVVAPSNSSEEAAPSPKRRALQDIRQANAATSLSTDQDSESDASMSERPQSQKENAPWDNSTLRQISRARTVQRAKQAKRAFKGFVAPVNPTKGPSDSALLGGMASTGSLKVTLEFQGRGNCIKLEHILNGSLRVSDPAHDGSSTGPTTLSGSNSPVAEEDASEAPGSEGPTATEKGAVVEKSDEAPAQERLGKEAVDFGHEPQTRHVRQLEVVAQSTIGPKSIAVPEKRTSGRGSRSNKRDIDQAPVGMLALQSAPAKQRRIAGPASQALKASGAAEPLSPEVQVTATERSSPPLIQEDDSEKGFIDRAVNEHILRERAKMCPSNKLAARRFKAKLQKWAGERGISDTYDALWIGRARQSAINQLGAFSQLTAASCAGLDQLED